MNRIFCDKICSEKECIEIQNELKKKIIKRNTFANASINNIAGVDLAYWGKDDREYAVCCIVVIDVNTKKVIENVHVVDEISFPYIPGCLAFRELPLVLKTVKTLQSQLDLYVFDGNGYLHPRHMGIATHASFYLEKPTIGVAKSYYKINDVDFIMPDNFSGAYKDIIINGEVYGRVLRVHQDVKPIFISIGNYIDLDTTTEIINNLVTKVSHIPMPTRLADIETHKLRTYYTQKYK